MPIYTCTHTNIHENKPKQHTYIEGSLGDSTSLAEMETGLWLRHVWLRQNIHVHVCFVQVLSSTVSKALSMSGGEEASETSYFVKMMDHFFDCLNVGNYISGKHSRNPFKQLHQTSSDFRLKVRILNSTCMDRYMDILPTCLYTCTPYSYCNGWKQSSLATLEAGKGQWQHVMDLVLLRRS